MCGSRASRRGCASILSSTFLCDPVHIKVSCLAPRQRCSYRACLILIETHSFSVLVSTVMMNGSLLTLALTVSKVSLILPGTSPCHEPRVTI